MKLVHEKKLTISELLSKMSFTPAGMLTATGLKLGTLEEGSIADVTIIKPDLVWTVEAKNFYSKGKNTPLDGMELKGKAVATIAAGKIVFNEID